MEVGAVGNLQHLRRAISAARRVLENSEHTLLAGLQATAFAQEMVCSYSACIRWHHLLDTLILQA